MRTVRTSAVLSCLALALGLSACGDGEQGAGAASGGQQTEEVEGTIAGAGATAQAAAQEAWIVGFQDMNPGATVSYDPIGSGGGREQFIAGGIAFAGTDASLEPEELEGADQRCGQTLQLPAYVSPIALAYNLPGVERLQLSAAAIAGIFNQDITNWSDPAIAETNPGVQLPDLGITPVNRSDESGTTENFAEYLAAVAPDVWSYEVDGNWPVPGGEAADGTSGVVGAIEAGEGAIGYADASQVGDLPVATVRVGKEFVGPTPEAAAAILEASEPEDRGGPYFFSYDLNRETQDSGAYPIVLVSYLLGCSEYDDENTASVVRAYFDYIISPEGQQAAQENAGSAPLSEPLRKKLQPAVDAISAGGPAG